MPPTVAHRHGGRPDAGTSSAEASPANTAPPEVIRGRAGTPTLERFRMAHIREICGEPGDSTTYEIDGRRYTFVCIEDDHFGNAEGGFLPLSMDGYQQSRWGMSPKQLRKAVPRVRTHEGLHFSEVTVAGFKGLAGYLFVNNKLVRVGVSLAGGTQKGLPQRQQCDAILKGLSEKYGPPVELENEYGKRLFWWNNHTTTLKFTFDWKDDCKLIYESRALADEVEQVSTEGL
jgi:hypothetical protein